MNNQKNKLINIRELLTNNMIKNIKNKKIINQPTK